MFAKLLHRSSETPRPPLAGGVPSGVVSTTATAPLAVSPQRIRLTLVGVMLGMLLAMLDNFIVGTAMPTILGDLGGVGLLSWVVTAYTLTTAVSTPIWGKLGDLYGRKSMFQLAVVGFVIGSVLASLAPSMTTLIAARAFQGLGAGGLAVGAFAVIADLVPPRERDRYQGMAAVVIAAGTIGGPLIGGFVTDALGWRWAFLINLPLGLATFVWIAFLLKLPTTRRKARIDWLGALLLSVAIAAVVLATSWAGSASQWQPLLSIGLGLTAVACLAVFIRHERRSTEPLVPLSLFANRNFTMAAVLGLVASAVSFACVVYVPLFLQGVQAGSASSSGLLLLPMMIPVVIFSQMTGRRMTATGRYKTLLVIGTILTTVGSALLATMTTTTSFITTSTFLVFMGIGSGLTQMTITIAQNSVKRGDMGAASSTVTLLRSIGGSIAVAAFGSVYASQTVGLTGTPLREGATRATSTIFVLVACVAACGVAAALAIMEIPLRGSDANPTSPSPAVPPVLVPVLVPVPVGLVADTISPTGSPLPGLSPSLTTVSLGFRTSRDAGTSRSPASPSSTRSPPA